MVRSRRTTVGYTRVSTAEQADKDTLETQRTTIKRLCEAKEWKLARKLGKRGIYEDVAEHSDDINREELEKLIAATKKGKVGRLVVPFMDRLLRGPRLMDALIGFFRVYNVEIYFGDFGLVDERIRSVLDFHGAAGKQFLKNLRDRTKLSVNAAQEKGIKVGRSPVGFTVGRNTEWCSKKCSENCIGAHQWVMTPLGEKIEMFAQEGYSPVDIKNMGLKYGPGKKSRKELSLTHILRVLRNVEAFRENRLEEFIAEGREEREAFRRQKDREREDKETATIREIEDWTIQRRRWLEDKA